MLLVVRDISLDTETILTEHLLAPLKLRRVDAKGCSPSVAPKSPLGQSRQTLKHEVICQEGAKCCELSKENSFAKPGPAVKAPPPFGWLLFSLESWELDILSIFIPGLCLRGLVETNLIFEIRRPEFRSCLCLYLPVGPLGAHSY